MKKGLFSILAGALLVVGCQNYDDQFSNIESQITALASQVAGLSQVQSDLTALAGTVNSLQSSVSETVDAALADGLADIATATASLNAAAATAASSEDVAAIAAAVAANQDDLTDLLSQSSVFQGPVVISSVASLNAFHAMGDGLKIVANNVTFDVKTDMDMVKVQAVADVLETITGDLSYTAAAGMTTEAVFNNLTGTASLTLSQPGGYHFPVLTSATYVTLNDAFESLVTRVNFPALTNVTSIGGADAGTGNVVEFTKATSMNFAALKYYTPGSLTLKMKRGTATEPSTMDITALDDVDALDVQTALDLTISGPNTVAISKLDGKGGSLTFDTVDSVTVTDYDGDITINDKVTSFTSNNVVSLAGTLADVITMDITGAIDPNNTADKSGPAIALTQDDFNVVKLKGKLASVSVDGADRLTTLWVYADVNAGSISVKGNGDLTAIDLTGSKASGVTLDNNDRLTSAIVNTTIQKSIATGATLDGSIVVTNSSDLESLTIGTATAPAASVSVLTITGNPLLATIDATNLTTLGATAASNKVNIYDNLFTASKVKDITNAAATTAALGAVGLVGDLGAITSTSGMKTLATYLDLVGANTSAAASVYIDVITSVVGTDGIEDFADVTYSSTTARTPANADNAQRILVKTANTADTGDAITTSKRSFLIDNDATALSLYANGIAIHHGSASVVIATSNAQTVANIMTTAALAQASIAGVTMTATGNAEPEAYVVLGENTTAAENSATAVSATSFVFNASDTFTISIGGTAAKPAYSATVTGTGYAAATELLGVNKLGQAFLTAWTTKYTTGTPASAQLVRWTLSSLTTTNSDLTNNSAYMLKFVAKDKGTGSIGAAVRVTVTSGKTATFTNVGYIIGNKNNFTVSTADNVAQGTGVVLTLAATSAGSLLGQIGQPLDNSSGLRAENKGAKRVQLGVAATSKASELGSTYKPNAATGSNVTTALHLYPLESRRNDVINGEEPNAAQPSDAVNFTRVGWL